jgi:cytochrome P450
MTAGPEFRHRPDGVCINTPTAHRHIYGPRGNVQKSEIYSIWPRTVDSLNTWSATSNEVHGQKRRVLNYAFSENALRGAEAFIHNNVDRWLLLLSDRKKTQDGWTISINMAEEIAYLVMDILGDLSFGKCFNMKEAGSDLRHVVDLMIGFIAMLNPVSHFTSSGDTADSISTRTRLGLLRGFG